MVDSPEELLSKQEPTRKPLDINKAESSPPSSLIENTIPSVESPTLNEERQRKEILNFINQQEIGEQTGEAPRKQVTPNAISSSNDFISNHAPSVSRKIRNFFTDSRLRALVGTVAKTWGIVLGTDLITSIAGYPELALYATIPVALYGLYRTWTSVMGGGIKLGLFTNLFKEYAVKPEVTSIGIVRPGEFVGSIHLFNNAGKMSDMSARERALAVPLDGLKGLVKLGEKFEQNSKNVRDVVVLKVRSHLVAQNRKLFEELGFTLQDQSQAEKNSSANIIAGKILIPSIWGIRQLFRERSLRGFREANQIRLGEIQTAWITPQQLCSPQTKTALTEKIQEIEPVLNRVLNKLKS